MTTDDNEDIDLTKTKRRFSRGKGTHTPHYSGAPFMHMAQDSEVVNGLVTTLCGKKVKPERVNTDPSCPDCLYILRDMKRNKETKP